MIKLQYIFVFLFFTFNIYSQDTNLYQTWYLYQLEVDLEGVVWDIEDEQPNFSPSITINDDLTFDGVGACNGFYGYYTYNSSLNSLNPNDVVFTLSVCDTSEENNFEGSYFNYIEADTDHTITLTSYDDYDELRLENYPGYIAIYRNVSLSIAEKFINQIKVYPNPVQDKLNIDYKGSDFLTLNILDIRGAVILENVTLSPTIDTSQLSKGLYFLEIKSDHGEMIVKFIKN